jgi:hypothetical protein
VIILQFEGREIINEAGKVSKDRLFESTYKLISFGN